MSEAVTDVTLLPTLLQADLIQCKPRSEGYGSPWVWELPRSAS